MKNKKHYYVSRNNIFTWMMVLCLAASAVARITITGLKGSGGSLFLWGQIILPIAAAILYIYITLQNGEERFYRTIIPVWMITAYFAFSVTTHDFSKKFIILCWVTLLLIGVLYTSITAGQKGKPYYMIPLIACLAVIVGIKHTAQQNGFKDIAIMALPDFLLLLGLVTLIFALRSHSAEEYYPHWGDRADGRRIKSLPPMTQMIPYIMVTRNTATNSFAESFDIADVEKYIHKKRAEGLTSFGITHVLLASYVRALCKYPALNRFIAGQRIYSRGEDIQFNMVIKKDMSPDSPDTVIKVHLNRTDTAEDVYNKMNAEVEKVKATSELDSNFDNVAQAFSMIPNLLLKFTIWLLKTLDYFGIMPRFVEQISPFHGSIFFTSMGSLKIPPIYHHLYDFGNVPVFVAFGCKRKALELQKDGSVVQKMYVDCKFTMDERITDGYYYAAFFRHFKQIFIHPDILDNAPEELVADID